MVLRKSTMEIFYPSILKKVKKIKIKKPDLESEIPQILIKKNHPNGYF